MTLTPNGLKNYCKRVAGIRSSSIETEMRILSVAKYILNGYSKRAFLFQVIAENENWNVSERQIDDYIAKAKEVIRYSNTEIDLKLEKDIALNRLEGLYVMNTKIQDFNQARAVTMDRMKLLGALSDRPIKEEKETKTSLIVKQTLATEATSQYLNTILAINKNKIVIQRGGTRSSKSYSNAQICVDWLLTGFIGDLEFQEDFSIVMESLPALRDTIVKDIIEILDNREIEYQHHQSFKYFVTPISKRRISYFSSDKISKMKRKSGFVWIDEADNTQYEFFQQLMSRVSTGRGLLSFNPSNPDIWINQKLEIERAQIKKDVKVLVSSYLENPFLSDAQIEEIEYLMSIDPEYLQVYGKGEYGNLTGLIYPVWELFKELPKNRTFMEVIGLDYGYTHPQAIVSCFIDREKREVYVYELMYETRTEFEDTTAVLEQCPDATAIIVDNARPELTSSYQNIFPNMEATKKYAGSLLDGIAVVKKYKVFVHCDAHNIIRENKSYMHAKNKQTGQTLEEPEKKNDDAMDAIRYPIQWYEAAYGYAYDQ